MQYKNGWSHILLKEILSMRTWNVYNLMNIIAINTQE